MTPTLTRHHGHALEVLASLPRGIARACITSPPYWMLRNYGTPAAHFPAFEFVPVAGLPPVQLPAWDGELGQERDPWAYVGHVVQIAREVRRCLMLGGTMWLNIGDTYARNSGSSVGDTRGMGRKHRGERPRGARRPPGTKHKDLLGIPWRLALALQAEGWWLRSEVIWNKPNGIPETAPDRPGRYHEHFFLFATAEQYHATEAMKGQRSVWNVPVGQYRGEHTAAFPPALIRPAILASSSPGDTILDPFGGSGTTGQVALENGRSAILVDVDAACLEMQDERCTLTPAFAL